MVRWTKPQRWCADSSATCRDRDPRTKAGIATLSSLTTAELARRSVVNLFGGELAIPDSRTTAEAGARAPATGFRGHKATPGSGGLWPAGKESVPKEPPPDR